MTIRRTILLCLAGSVLLSGSRVPQVYGQDARVPGASTSASEPLLAGERFEWFVNSTVGAKSLGAGVFSAAWGTARNNPEERGPHWQGFAERYGMRLTGVATGNAIEAALGSLWDEDPRYSRSVNAGKWGRIQHAAMMTVFAARKNEDLAPAYARYAGIVGNNFLSNTWRAPSERSASDALTRSMTGFAGKCISNVFDEFWPDVKRTIFRRK
jgi:hypothetical protein